MNKTTEKIPTWSLCYLTGGDRAGLTEEEVRLIDKWTSDWQVQIVSPLTDMDGNVFSYEVSSLETLSPYAVSDMTSGDWDLTLFTCTVGGQSRLAIRCDQAE